LCEVALGVSEFEVLDRVTVGHTESLYRISVVDRWNNSLKESMAGRYGFTCSIIALSAGRDAFSRRYSHSSSSDQFSFGSPLRRKCDENKMVLEQLEFYRAQGIVLPGFRDLGIWYAEKHGSLHVFPGEVWRDE